MKAKSIKPGELPSVSIVIPTHKRYPHFKQDKLVLRRLIEETGKRIESMLDKKNASRIISSLNGMEAKIDFRHLQDGLVMHYTPKGGYIYHLPFNPVEKLIIGQSLEIRDILYSLKIKNEYLILVISENRVKVLKNNNGISENITIGELPLGKNDTGGKGTSRTKSYSSSDKGQNVTDSKAYDEKKIKKYLKDIDSILSTNKKLQALPVVVCAPVRLIGKFKIITSNTDRIMGYLKGNFERKSDKEIVNTTDKLIKSADLKRQNKILAQVEKEGKKNHLIWGIRDVKRGAQENKGHLLVVEKDYRSSGVKPKRSGLQNANVDMVDDIIEKVLEKGGDVEFVDNGKLGAYGRIVMVSRY